MVDRVALEKVAIAELLMLMTELVLDVWHINGQMTQRRSSCGDRDIGGDAGTIDVDVE